MHRLAAVALLAAFVPGCTVTTGSSTPRTTTPPPPKSSGPVKLALYRPELAEGLTGGIDLEKFNASWRTQFAGFDLSSQDKCDKSQKDESKGRYNAFTLGIDVVRVKVLIGTVKKTGYDPKTKKPVEVTNLKYTATIIWSNDQRQEAVVEGSVFQNEPMLKDLAAKVKGMIR